jgi:hypothetical protein
MAVERRVTTQDISWFLDLYSNDQLNLDPPYQRRSVWSPKDRRYFLDTIFRGYPSPSIFLHKQVIDGKTIYSVVDGKQRLETILRFADNKISIDKNFGDIRLAGKRWKSIKRDEDLSRSFWDYVIPVEQTNIIDTNMVNEVFDRLNRNALKLVDQELRHAKFDGWFITFVETEAESPEWEQLGVVTTARAKRMKDVQFLSELLIVQLKGEVGGFDQEEISTYYAKYEDLLDLDGPFDEYAVKNKFYNSKKYLLELEKSGSIISKFATDFTDLYSLWAVVCLNSDKLPKQEIFATKYSTFMQEVNKYKNAEYFEKVIRGEIVPGISEALKYHQNNIGASTEAPQRVERHNALSSILLPQ